ncbi:MAG: aminotransferase class V-fold PLP-dependent enzyme [Desulfurococcales archaeon]|nr:aminotransferase class V-fold PLP-dependent enzyme [Desulfurococcales archaeon]
MAILSCQAYRGDFPELLNTGIIYFDNAASTLKPKHVIDAMNEFITKTYANVHRGVYNLAMESTRLYEEAHDIVSKLICAEQEEIVFTPQGTTNALQLVALLLHHNGILREGDEIIVPGDAHNSNLLPWRQIARWNKARVKVVPVDQNGIPRWDKLGELVSHRTRLIAVTHVSNVTGYESPLDKISKIAREVGAYIVVDGAQSVPHIPVCVNNLDIDFLAFSGHKMLGPTGIGVLWIRKELAYELEPPLAGGGTIKDVECKCGANNIRVDWEEPPWKFEAGTPPIIEAIGLAAAAEYLLMIGMANVAAHETYLTERMLRGLSQIDKVRIVGPSDPKMRRGIISFVVDKVHPDIIGIRLGQEGIAVRTGTHCANMMYHMLGLHEGSIRASFYLYNCPEEVDVFIEKLEKIVSE